MIQKIELTKDELNELFNIEGLFNDKRKKQILEAMKRGFKNEKCLKCGLKFMADVNFIRCNNEMCPMKSEDSKTLIDHIFDNRMNNNEPIKKCKQKELAEYLGVIPSTVSQYEPKKKELMLIGLAVLKEHNKTQSASCETKEMR